MPTKSLQKLDEFWHESLWAKSKQMTHRRIRSTSTDHAKPDNAPKTKGDLDETTIGVILLKWKILLLL